SVVLLAGKLLAKAEQRQGAGIVRNCRGRVLLNLSDRFIETSLVVELQGSRNCKALVLGIPGTFRQNLRGFVELTLRLQAPCFCRECAIIPGRDLQGAIKDLQRLVVTTDTLECIGEGQKNADVARVQLRGRL